MFSLFLTTIDTEQKKDKFTAIYKRYRNLMTRVAFDILHDFDMSQDATHSAFVVIADHLCMLDENSPRTKRFAVTVTKNISLNMLKHRNRETSLIEHLTSREEVFTPASEEQTTHAVYIEQAVAAIKELPETHRQILTLRFSKGLSNKQTAKLLNISLTAATKRLERARKALKAKLEGNGAATADDDSCRGNWNLK